MIQGRIVLTDQDPFQTPEFKALQAEVEALKKKMEAEIARVEKEYAETGVTVEMSDPNLLFEYREKVEQFMDYVQKHSPS